MVEGQKENFSVVLYIFKTIFNKFAVKCIEHIIGETFKNNSPPKKEKEEHPPQTPVTIIFGINI